jgi:hypothetical protein
MSSSNPISAYSLALVIQHAEKAIGFSFYQLQASCIIHELNVCPANTFLTIFFLLIFKNMLIEIILQMLISVVDTKLFKARNNTQECHLNNNILAVHPGYEIFSKMTVSVIMPFLHFTHS